MKFIDKVWDRSAIDRMMFITLTRDTEELVKWLIDANTKEKVEYIKTSIKQFK